MYQTYIRIGKSLFHPPPFILGLLHPKTMKPSVLPPELSKTVYFTPWAVFSGGCYSNSWVATVMVGLDFLIFGEFLKNHSKSWKNHKIKNLILLDST